MELHFLLEPKRLAYLTSFVQLTKGYVMVWKHTYYFYQLWCYEYLDFLSVSCSHQGTLNLVLLANKSIQDLYFLIHVSKKQALWFLSVLHHWQRTISWSLHEEHFHWTELFDHSPQSWSQEYQCPFHLSIFTFLCFILLVWSFKSARSGRF